MRAALLLLYVGGMVGCISTSRGHSTSSESIPSTNHKQQFITDKELTELLTKPTVKPVVPTTAPNSHAIVKNVCLDSSFSLMDRMYIIQGITQWNHALAGKMILSTYQGKHCDWKINSIDVDPYYASSANRTTLAFANAIGGDTINIIRSRVGSNEVKLKRVVMHEIGHLLGVEHSTDNHGLMSEYYSTTEYDSIDSRTLKIVFQKMR